MPREAASRASRVDARPAPRTRRSARSSRGDADTSSRDGNGQRVGAASALGRAAPAGTVAANDGSRSVSTVACATKAFAAACWSVRSCWRYRCGGLHVLRAAGPRHRAAHAVAARPALRLCRSLRNSPRSPLPDFARLAEQKRLAEARREPLPGRLQQLELRDVADWGGAAHTQVRNELAAGDAAMTTRDFAAALSRFGAAARGTRRARAATARRRRRAPRSRAIGVRCRARRRSHREVRGAAQGGACRCSRPQRSRPSASAR